MLWIGLTGGIASGKTTAGKILREMGYPVVDADAVARQVVEPGEEGAKALLHLIGPSFFDPQGMLRREKLAQYIFSDPKARGEVEAVLHPLIQKQVEREKRTLIQQGKKIAFYDVPLLFEKKLQGRFDRTLLIYASESLQKERLQGREGWTPDQIKSRLDVQIPIEQKRTLADHVIDNSGTLEDLKKELAKFVDDLAA